MNHPHIENENNPINSDTFVVFRNIRVGQLCRCMPVRVSINLLSTFVCSMILWRVMEQTINLKFLYNLGKSASETHKNLKQVYRDQTVTLRTAAYAWFKKFSDGRDSVEDEHRSVRVTTSKTETIIKGLRELLQQDRRITIRMLSDELDISQETVSNTRFEKTQAVVTRELKAVPFEEFARAFDDLYTRYQEGHIVRDNPILKDFKHFQCEAYSM